MTWSSREMNSLHEVVTALQAREAAALPEQEAFDHLRTAITRLEAHCKRTDDTFQHLQRRTDHVSESSMGQIALLEGLVHSYRADLSCSNDFFGQAVKSFTADIAGLSRHVEESFGRLDGMVKAAEERNFGTDSRIGGIEAQLWFVKSYGLSSDTNTTPQVKTPIQAEGVALSTNGIHVNGLVSPLSSARVGTWLREIDAELLPNVMDEWLSVDSANPD